MYIYHALINALSAHTIYINLNTIFYTQSYQNNLHKVLYGNTHTHIHTQSDVHKVTSLFKNVFNNQKTTTTPDSFQMNNHMVNKMRLVPSPLQPREPDSGTHPADMPQLQHVEKDSLASGYTPADMSTTC